VHEANGGHHGQKPRMTLDVIAEVKDTYGLTVQNMRDTLDIRLSDLTASTLPGPCRILGSAGRRRRETGRTVPTMSRRASG